MKTGFSPGPWNAEGPEIDSNQYSVIAVAKHGKVTEDADGNQISIEEAEANALLLAAAPELLEACKARLAADQQWEQGTEEWHKAIVAADVMMESAIKKAGAG